jgi:hypothetical protein
MPFLNAIASTPYSIGETEYFAVGSVHAVGGRPISSSNSPPILEARPGRAGAFAPTCRRKYSIPLMRTAPTRVCKRSGDFNRACHGVAGSSNMSDPGPRLRRWTSQLGSPAPARSPSLPGHLRRWHRHSSRHAGKRRAVRQCGDDVLRMLVTGGPPARGVAACPSASWPVHGQCRCYG